MIDFKTSFGTPKSGNSATANSDKPKAQFWLNLGYTVDIPETEQGETTKFVSLPQGIPLDTQEVLATNGKNREFAAFQTARNDLFEQVMAHAATLQPGEDCILNLQIQLRRVNEDATPIATDENPYARKVVL